MSNCLEGRELLQEAPLRSMQCRKLPSLHNIITSVSPKAVNWAEDAHAYDSRERGISSTCPDKNIASTVEKTPRRRLGVGAGCMLHTRGRHVEGDSGSPISPAYTNFR